ncbi:K+ channel tetramerization subfamily protein [Pelomyxa schiedti]|nr:K+ channel tetramerization subfamily protein [Pelomyxa schiedti]
MFRGATTNKKKKPRKCGAAVVEVPNPSSTCAAAPQTSTEPASGTVTSTTATTATTASTSTTTPTNSVAAATPMTGNLACDQMFGRVDTTMSALQDEMKNKIATVHFPSTIKLDVGGKVFKTSQSTLTKEPSMLATMFSGSGVPVQKDEDDGSGLLWVQSLMRILTQKVFTWSSPSDKDGLFYWIGSSQGTTNYLDPIKRDTIILETTFGSASGLVAHPEYGNHKIQCGDARNKHFTIKFTNKKWLFCPNYCTLSWTGQCQVPSNWALSGSHNGTTWVTLSQHTDDNTLSNNQRASWPISTTQLFNQFRVTCTGKSTVQAEAMQMMYYTNSNCFHVTGLELLRHSPHQKCFSQHEFQGNS